MGKLSADIRIPLEESSGYTNAGSTNRAQVTAIRDYLRQVAIQVGLISEGHIDGHYNAMDAMPTGAGKNGDKIWKRTVSKEGAVGAKYVTIGFICTVSGDPATWEEMRVTTGN